MKDFWLISEIIDKGAIFCQVIKIKQLNHDNPSETVGSHIWKGEAPNLTLNDKSIIDEIIHGVIEIDWIIEKKEDDKRKENKKIEEAIDWIKKYFIEASEQRLLEWEEIKGINPIKLISIPIQAMNQEDDLIVIKDPKSITKKNKLFV